MSTQSWESRALIGEQEAIDGALRARPTLSALNRDQIAARRATWAARRALEHAHEAIHACQTAVAKAEAHEVAARDAYLKDLRKPAGSHEVL